MSNCTSSCEVLNLDNPGFCTYLICTSLLILKIMCVPLLTIFHRFRNKVFICQEDAKWLNGKVEINDVVERTRRAHLNDLENIPIFLIISLGYLWTRPALWFLQLLLSVYTIVRFLHTFVYTIVIMPQPTRASLWAVGYIITGYMAIHTAIYAFISIIS